MSGSGISWDICKSATRSRQITMPAPHHSSWYKSWSLACICCTLCECLSVCLLVYLKNCSFKLYQIFCSCYLWLWLSSDDVVILDVLLVLWMTSRYSISHCRSEYKSPKQLQVCRLLVGGLQHVPCSIKARSKVTVPSNRAFFVGTVASGHYGTTWWLVNVHITGDCLIQLVVLLLCRWRANSFIH